ncbi:MAG: ArsC/Spx/MgsR family protein [Saprospiraceae bacterium]
MKKIFHLNTCNTCQRILTEWNAPASFSVQNIKEENIDAKSLDFAAKKLGSYEALFSRRAIKYKTQGLANKTLSEKDYRKLILEEYTFLKRPVMINEDQVFAGNAAATVLAAKLSLKGK